MLLLERIEEMRGWSEEARRAGRRIGFVPTMGFLHEGHLALVREARRRADRVVVSIFVNPTQFGPNEDFASYPRDLERDRRLLECEAVDVLFHPKAEEIYPGGDQTRVEVELLSSPLCGAFRPGHFRGVATVLVKLFNIVRPHMAVFGRKDFQQLQLVRRLVKDLAYDIEIVGHATVREPDGLAMSSRNVYLAPEERRAALSLSRSLLAARCLARQGERRGSAVVAAVRDAIANEPLAQIEYVKLCDPETLEDIEEIGESALLALAVRIGKTRLIDNTILP
ncbi:MAG TPA: pantoate--beta-alanine ligase [candidate division Zixibacteria bacterium]|nr:pantoate--beta-alanine ligase [candidate division Zixibacteria bacterium]